VLVDAQHGRERWHQCHAALGHDARLVWSHKNAMLDAVDARFEGIANAGDAVRVGGCAQSREVGGIDGGSHFRNGQFRLRGLFAFAGDADASARHHLDQVRASLDLLARGLACFVGAIDFDPCRRAMTTRHDQRLPSAEEARAVDVAFLDGAAHHEVNLAL
jgi:hypothetical protein